LWRWTGATLGGLATDTTTVPSGITLAATGGAAKNLSARTMAVSAGGTASLLGGNLQLAAGAVVNNSGTFEVKDDADFVNAGGGGTFNNQAGATFRKSDGAGTTSIGVSIAFNNSGLVEAESGTISFVAGAYTHNGGTLRVENGANIAFSSAVTLAGGALEGVGSITTTKLTANGMAISPGLSSGILTLNGGLEMNGSAKVSFELGGLDPGNGTGFHDQLIVNGQATVGGTIEVRFLNGFQSALTGAESFTVLDSTLPIAGSFFNAFNGSRINTADGLGSFLVAYGVGGVSDRLILSGFQAIPEPELGASLIALGLIAWTWRRRA
jgi:hypothetical protein